MRSRYGRVAILRSKAVLAGTTALLVAMVGLAWPAVSPAPARAAGQTIKLMPLGDSIIDGSSTYPGGSRVKLYQTYFKNNGYDVDFVGGSQNGPSSNFDRDNEGHSGWTIGQIRSIVDASLAKYQPDVIMLHIGGNDLFGGSSASVIGTRLTDLINRICVDRPGVRIVFSTNHDIPSNQTGINGMNDTFRKVVPTLNTSSCHVSMVEMRGVVSPSDLGDTFHPNKSGYDKMADVWWPKVKEALDAVKGGSATPTPTPTPVVTATPVPGTTRKGDINGDGRVNITDLSILLSSWSP